MSGHRQVGSGSSQGAAVMSNDLTGLYQEMIIDHSRRPRNFGELEGATRTVDAVNPLCGDQLTLYLHLADGTITDVAFDGAGCAISQASASLMTEALKGMAHAEALALFTRVHTMLTSGSGGDVPPTEVGKLAVLSGVWRYPARVKCATLAWQALRSALDSSAFEDAGHRDGTV